MKNCLSVVAFTLIYALLSTAYAGLTTDTPIFNREPLHLFFFGLGLLVLSLLAKGSDKH